MSARDHLSLTLGALKTPWEAWCAQRGVSPAEGVLQLLHAVLEMEGYARNAGPSSSARAPAVGKAHVRVQVRMTPGESDCVALCARASGFTVNRWIVALIRAKVAREAQLGEEEQRLLAESNRQLVLIRSALGRYMPRSDAGETAGAMQVEALRELIEAHLRTVNRALRSNVDRWSR